jgi:transposase-like protein
VKASSNFNCVSPKEIVKAALVEFHTELQAINRSAARSLAEGLEETLTFPPLGVYEELGRSLKTTNCIESLNSRLEACRQGETLALLRAAAAVDRTLAAGGRAGDAPH